MAIYQRKKIWWIDYYFEGRRLREPVSESRREALAALHARKADIARGRFELPKGASRPTFDGFAAEYGEHLRRTRSAWKKEISRLKTLVKHFGAFRLSEVTTFEVEKYKAARRAQVSGATANRELALLETMFNKAVRWGFVKMENPVRGISRFPERQKERILGDEEASRLVGACGPTLRPVVVLALNTGMRKSEILGLSWRDVDFSRRYLRVERSKNNRSRKVPLNSAVVEELRRLRASGSESVFTTRQGQSRLNCVRSAFLTACRRAGLEGLRFHDLRHTFATNLVMSGVDLVTVKEILGHSDISMTVRYSHPSDGRKLGAVEGLVKRSGGPAESSFEGPDGHKSVTSAEKASEPLAAIH